MKTTTLQAVFGAAAMLLSAPVQAKPGRHHVYPHRREHQRLHVRQTEEASPIAKRGGQCQFPDDDSDLVAVTPDESNAGWAMSPDQPCEPDSYCPFACKPGMVMAQWDPDAKPFHSSSINGGLYCDKNGKMKKPFPEKPNCVKGTGTVEVVNKCGKPLSYCQTVFPGNEAMLIPTLISSTATLAVPDQEYFHNTGAHYYVNPPGTGEEGCIWGDDSSPIGNWSPYVVGVKTDSDGNTFVTLSWNPIWEGCSLKSTKPTFGLEIKCEGGCNEPCKIEPDGAGQVESKQSSSGAGGANFCTATIPSGQIAQVVVFEAGSGSGSDSSSEDSSDSTSESVSESAASSSAAPESTSSTWSEPETTSQEPETTSEAPTSTYEEPTTTSAPLTTSLWSSILETTPTPEPETTSTTPIPTSTEETSSSVFESTSLSTSSSSTSTPSPTPTLTPTSSSSTSTSTSTSIIISTSTSTSSATPIPTPKTSSKKYPTVKPGIFQESRNTTTPTFYNPTSTEVAAVATKAVSEARPHTSKEGEAGRQQGSAAFAGLVVAFIAAACFF